MKTHPSLRQTALLLLLAAGAIAVHGYHPFAEDGEIYIPGIKHILNPALYPYNAAFFESHAHMTLFPYLIAESIRVTHVPLEWGLLGWQFLSIFLLLLASWRVGRLALGTSRAAWGATALVGALLTLPVAGTALYIMDPYLTTRSLSAPAVLFLAVDTLEQKYGRATAWAVFTVLIHPLMAVFGLSFAAAIVWRRSRPLHFGVGLAALIFPLGMFPPVTSAYREVLATRPYFFLGQWAWYEWLGLLAPMAVLWWFQRIGRAKKLPVLELLCGALLLFGAIWFLVSAALTLPPAFARFAELQPMRYLHLLYILMFALSGGLLAEFLLQRQVWRWLILLIPLCAGMAYAQRQLYPAEPHIEWPDEQPHTDWMRAFVWIRANTPVNAYFALDPEHMRMRGEDEEGFRAIAERSMLADRVKDSGAVSMFPQLAGTWEAEVQAEDGWDHLQLADFERLRRRFGVDWVVLEGRDVTGLECPYRNNSLAVCRIPPG